MPVLISRMGGATKIIACKAIGANRRATSERKTTLVNTSKEIARSSLDCVGVARAGAFGIKKERATLTDVKHGVMTPGFVDCVYTHRGTARTCLAMSCPSRMVSGIACR